MNNLLSYKNGNLLFNNTIISNIEMSKDEALIFVDSINEFISDISEGGNIIEVKSSDDNIGLIVDIWSDSRFDDLVETSTFYFDDFLVF